MQRSEMRKKKRKLLFGRKGMTSTLGIVLFSVRGKNVVLELKNDTEVHGILEEVDTFMNATVVDVKIKNVVTGTLRSFEELYVKGTSVRYVFMPKEVDLRSHVRKYTDSLATLARQKPKKKG